MGSIETAHTFNALMHQLNYPRYVIQGGDLGGITLRYQASLFPESVVSILSNFWIIPPNATVLPAMTPESDNAAGDHLYS